MNQHLILCSVCLVSSKFKRRFKCRLGGGGGGGGGGVGWGGGKGCFSYK